MIDSHLDDARILANYDLAQSSALQIWSEHPDAGAALPADIRRAKLGVSSGCLFTAVGEIALVHARLTELARDDPRLEVVPAASLHFTFLALAWDRYTDVSDIPSEIAHVKVAFAHATRDLNFTVRALRLLPLKNALVLAGLPDDATRAARDRFAADVLASPWRRLIEQRYAGVDIPPRFWHTTLARCSSERLPPAARRAYFDFAGADLGALSLGKPRLAAVNSTWSRCHVLA